MMFFSYQNHIVQYTEEREKFCLTQYKKICPTRLHRRLHQGLALCLTQPFISSICPEVDAYYMKICFKGIKIYP